MKKLGILLFVAVLSIGFMSAQNRAPQVKFSTDTHDFGRVAEEVEQVTCSFQFTNTGTAPLVINTVKASCGCTTPSYTKEPVLPGQTGDIKVAYSTTNRIGSFNKTIRVFTNVQDSTFVLTIKGEVLPRK